MKKLIVFCLAALVTVYCFGADVKYVVKGSGAKDGTVVYLVDKISNERINSTVVSRGTFQMKGKAPKDAFLAVQADGSGWQCLFFNDGQNVQVNLADSTVTGSPLNTRLTECDKKTNKSVAKYEALAEEISKLPREKQMSRVMSLMAATREMIEGYLNVIDENMDNLIPVAFVEEIPALVNQAKFEELLASGKPFAKHPYVLEVKRRMEETAARQKDAQEKKQAVIGKKFLDLEMSDTQGKVHKLSEYVGKGNWVLIDFWASWCGPCKAEMPNVTAAYKQYHAKGFDIVGLSFDRDKDLWVKAVTDWDMPWIHLSDSKYWKSIAAGVYSVNAIPDNLLIDPQGTVVARGLRGDALRQKLAEIFK
jgi:peroxiredoxin